MMGGLHFDSLADLPECLRVQAARQILQGQKAEPEAEAPAKPTGKRPKYSNIKTEMAGLTFDSRKEARRYETLKLAQEKGLIHDLRLQQDYTLQEAYTQPDGTRIRAIRYSADFTYRVNAAARQIIEQSRQLYLWFSLQDLDFWARNGGLPYAIIEDVKSKGTRTDKYKIKKKMMAAQGHEIREV